MRSHISLNGNKQNDLNDRCLIQERSDHSNFLKIGVEYYAKKAWETFYIAYEGTNRVKCCKLLGRNLRIHLWNDKCIK